jgi:hypothetical protein
MSAPAERPTVGSIGLSDQGLPMASSVAEAGYPLHVWARRAASFDALDDTPYVRHDDNTSDPPLLPAPRLCVCGHPVHFPRNSACCRLLCSVHRGPRVARTMKDSASGEINSGPELGN